MSHATYVEALVGRRNRGQRSMTVLLAFRINTRDSYTCSQPALFFVRSTANVTEETEY